MKSAGRLYKEIFAQLFPSGQPENLAVSSVPGVLAPHRQHFDEALADIAKFVRCERENIVNVIDFCETKFKCGMTIVPMPNGNVTRVTVVVNTDAGPDYCDPVDYREVMWPEVECVGRRAMNFSGIEPSVSGLLPLGVLDAGPATDSKCGRARVGIWVKHRGNIYIAPWIQSVERILIEWDGIKLAWGDADPVNEEQDYKLAVQFYCQYAHERDYGSPEKSGFYKQQYDHAYGELAWTCEQKLKVRNTPVCVGSAQHTGLYAYSIRRIHEQTGIVAAAVDPVIAHVGNIGDGDGSVALLVDGLGANAVVNSGNVAMVSDDYDLSVGKFWHPYLLPYYGAFSDPASVPDENQFWPAIGSGDDLVKWLSFFSTPDNQTNYDVCIWPAHFFFFDATTDPDASWLQAKMLLSPAPWKIVVLYANPYSSFAWDPLVRKQFKSWGANLVLSAGSRFYERLSVAGLTYIVNGCGGASLTALPGSLVSESQAVASVFGAGKITAGDKLIKYEFVDLGGVVIDTVEITK